MRDSRPQEARLLDLARAGDQAAFNELVAPLREKIYWRAAKAVSDLDEAEDVTQETILRAFTRLDTFRGDARFSSWLYQVGTNCIRMHLRSKRRRRSYPMEDHQREAERAMENSHLSPAPQGPDDIAINRELKAAIADAMSQLPPQYGSILRLWVDEGLDLKQIQDRSGLSIAAIKSRLHRARRKVRDAIESKHGVGAILAA
ncbi:MAG: RNA polymerase sigma-70 factor (ECF subfamily) [Bradymonadia bacterium]|jgi:RNA polymerase sigma-70 factor (ECF subfamily)